MDVCTINYNRLGVFIYEKYSYLKIEARMQNLWPPKVGLPKSIIQIFLGQTYVIII